MIPALIFELGRQSRLALVSVGENVASADVEQQRSAVDWAGGDGFAKIPLVSKLSHVGTWQTTEVGLELLRQYLELLHTEVVGLLFRAIDRLIHVLYRHRSNHGKDRHRYDDFDQRHAVARSSCCFLCVWHSVALLFRIEPIALEIQNVKHLEHGHVHGEYDPADASGQSDG